MALWFISPKQNSVFELFVYPAAFLTSQRAATHEPCESHKLLPKSGSFSSFPKWRQKETDTVISDFPHQHILFFSSPKHVSKVSISISPAPFWITAAFPPPTGAFCLQFCFSESRSSSHASPQPFPTCSPKNSGSSLFYNSNKVVSLSIENPLKGILILAGVAQWTEYQPANHSTASSIPSQGTCLGCRPGPQLGACERQLIDDISLAHWYFSPSFFPSLTLSLKIDT